MQAVDLELGCMPRMNWASSQTSGGSPFLTNLDIISQTVITCFLWPGILFTVPILLMVHGFIFLLMFTEILPKYL